MRRQQITANASVKFNDKSFLRKTILRGIGQLAYISKDVSLYTNNIVFTV
jgi:hypothetical protein